jgi:hypothetical protein
MGDLPAAVIMIVLGTVVASILIRSYDDAERGFLWASFAAHQVSALAMVAIVGGFYGSGDLFGYLRAGKFLAGRLRDDFLDMAPRLFSILIQQSGPLPFPGIAGGSNTGTMQALSGFLCFFFGSSVFGVCLAIATFSFIAKTVFYRALRAELPEVPRPLLLASCLLVPSAVFWSSGLLKEPLAVIGLAGMIYGAHSVVRYGRYVSGFIWLALGTLFVGLLKGYLLAPFGIGAGLFFASRAIFAGGKTVQPRYLVLAVVIAVGSIMATGAALPHFSAETFADEARMAQAVGQRTQGGSNYALSGGSVVSQLPLALITVLFRPFIFEISNVMVAITALEMLAAAFLTVRAVARGSFMDAIRHILSRPALCFCFGFVLTLAVGVGLTTTNLGTLSRYRMPLMPFYATLLVVLAYRVVPKTQRLALANQATFPIARPPVRR